MHKIDKTCVPDNPAVCRQEPLAFLPDRCGYFITIFWMENRFPCTTKFLIPRFFIYENAVFTNTIPVFCNNILAVIADCQAVNISIVFIPRLAVYNYRPGAFCKWLIT